ncbi:M23 family metallopeptidase [Kocuria sp. M1R5S2]|uniref:M23 family metallopeptidase n=1 Tax=Kocuria rhizosphaerae TaxID=3376285 RepID=UPI0037948028
MSRSLDRIGRSDRRRRVLRLLAGLAWTVLLLVAAAAGPSGAPTASAVGGPGVSAAGTGGPSAIPSATGDPSASPAGTGGPEEDRSRLGWSLFHAAAEQWQFGFALRQVGSPWQHDFPLVSKLRPRAEAPRYQGTLPLNTIVAPATPTDVHPAGAYGWRVAPDIGVEELHNGADIGAPSGTPVLSALDGVVRAVFWDVWGGNRVEVSHVGDMVTTYNHLEDVQVRTGDRLRASQQLGTVGATGARVTGPHLHFETWVDSKAVDPQSFDWMDGDRIIPAPRGPGQEPPQIPRGGKGDKSTVDAAQSCPYERSDPSRCRPPESGPPTAPSAWPPFEQCTDLLYGRYNCVPLEDPVGPEDCPAAVGGRVDCPPVVWPELLDPSVCTELPYGRYNCVPLEDPAGQEDCPSAVAGGRVDCPPVVWPELLDPSVCTELLYGRYNCVPLEDPAGQEDCPAAVGGRVDCLPVVWPELLDPSVCTELLYGRYNCLPLEDPAGQEDCPAAVGGRVDCPPVVWPELLDPSVCTDLLHGRYNCVPLEDPAGQEDCPAAVGGRLDCPPEVQVPDETLPTVPAGEDGVTSPGPDVLVPDVREPDIALPEVPFPNRDLGLRRVERPAPGGPARRPGPHRAAVGPGRQEPRNPPRKLKKH